MNLGEIMYIIALFSALLINIFKLYNVVNRAKLYSMFTALLLFAGYCLTWLFMLIVTLQNLETHIYSLTFLLISFLFVMQIFFLAMELYYNLADQAASLIRQSYRPAR